MRCSCNIGEMPRKVQVKCAIAGCYRRLKMTLAEREELRLVGRENNAAAGLVCPAHVKAAFNFELDDIDIDVPPGELLVETSRDTPHWRVMLTPRPGAAGEPDSQSTPGLEAGSFSSPESVRSSPRVSFGYNPVDIIQAAPGTGAFDYGHAPDSVEIYCLKYRSKTGSRDIEQVTLKNGRPALRAVCTVCGTGKYRIGSAG